MTEHADRGRDSGRALTEVRTVLSRARTALHVLETYGPMEFPPKTGDREADDYRVRKAAQFDDPDLADMTAALRETVTRLERWEKTGRTTRSTCL